MTDKQTCVLLQYHAASYTSYLQITQLVNQMTCESHWWSLRYNQTPATLAATSQYPLSTPIAETITRIAKQTTLVFPDSSIDFSISSSSLDPLEHYILAMTSNPTIIHGHDGFRDPAIVIGKLYYCIGLPFSLTPGCWLVSILRITGPFKPS